MLDQGKHTLVGLRRPVHTCYGVALLRTLMHYQIMKWDVTHRVTSAVENLCYKNPLVRGLSIIGTEGARCALPEVSLADQKPCMCGCSTAYDVVVKDSPWQAEYFTTSGPLEGKVGK